MSSVDVVVVSEAQVGLIIRVIREETEVTEQSLVNSHQLIHSTGLCRTLAKKRRIWRNPIACSDVTDTCTEGHVVSTKSMREINLCRPKIRRIYTERL